MPPRGISSFRIVKLRETVVKTDDEPKSIVLGPPVTNSRSFGDNGCLHSRISSGAVGFGLNFRG